MTIDGELLTEMLHHIRVFSAVRRDIIENQKVVIFADWQRLQESEAWLIQIGEKLSLPEGGDA